ncbi:MAG: DNA repair protein RecO [Leptolyngbyaceae cyanobacterium SM1_1_3]|nr:DNA repair protein RecO [Leptolyngbyaceae cyanobacterium SM1_1_3]NJN01617.1 DNA repair protein RecO [Leptolyngbyaceae cyanobacterium RM1_1_2]NJO09862.1 DNA repair protein RecO [Leptolyngbyaceae cyanobacterium SL_1_1]
MSRTYKVAGINLKGAPFGESDRLVTVLTQELGLIRAVAPGSRKHNSRLAGRSGLFVVNQLLLSKGKSLDRILQAETIRSYPGLSANLPKLTASQYLAEITLYQALSEQPQEALFCLLLEHLERLEQASAAAVLPCLAQATFHLLALAGIAPQVHLCCVTQEPIVPNLADPDWHVGFSLSAGGTVQVAESEALGDRTPQSTSPASRLQTGVADLERSRSAISTRTSARASPPGHSRQADRVFQLNALELALFQQLSQPHLLVVQPLTKQLPASVTAAPHQLWYRIERLLRHYVQYHLDRSIRSAALIDACFAPASPSK